MNIENLVHALARHQDLQGVRMDLIRSEAERLVNRLADADDKSDGFADAAVEESIATISAIHHARQTDTLVDKLNHTYGD